MKILYTIQATGNGHLSRALEIIPHLQKHGELDILTSGIQGDVILPYPIKYKKYGISCIFGKKGGVDILASLKKLKLISFIKDVRSNIIDDYDLVINDFEPITAWACKLKNKKCIGLSHQAAFLSKNAPRPQKKHSLFDPFIRNYAPIKNNIAFHFQEYDDFIHTPIIRKAIRDLSVTTDGHYTVYLPAVGDDVIIKHLSKIKNVNWYVFSKHSKVSYSCDNVYINPISGSDWLKSLAAATGVIMGAGFEGPSEAIFLGKKLLVVPMHNQYEQLCNAAALQELGVTVLDKIDRYFSVQVENWIDTAETIHIDYPDQTEEIVASIFE